MPKPTKKGKTKTKKKEKKDKHLDSPSGNATLTSSPSTSSPSPLSPTSNNPLITTEELDSLFQRLSTSPNRSKSIVADLLRGGKIGGKDVTRLADDLNNAYSLVHDRGVPLSELRLVQAEDSESGDRVIKVDMTDAAIRFLCQNEDDSDESHHTNHNTSTITTSNNNNNTNNSINNNIVSSNGSSSNGNSNSSSNGHIHNNNNINNTSSNGNSISSNNIISINNSNTSNNHYHQNGHTPTVARNSDGLPILTLITSQTNSPAPYADITSEEERRKKAISEKEKGNDMYQRKKFMEAAQHYTAAIELFPSDMVFFLNRAAAFYELSMYYKAVVDCWQAVELGSHDPTTTPKLLSKAWFRMGQSRFKLQYIAECIEAYKKSIELNPSSESNQLALTAIAKAEQLAQSPPDFKSLQTTPESQRRTFVPPAASSLKAQVCVHCKEMLGEVRTPCPCCGLLLYCGAEHQGLDWPSHRSLCADLRMYVDDEFGEHGPVLIALSDQYRKTRLSEWDEYFRTRCVRVGGCSDRSCRMLTDSVTYPLTIVYSLQMLKIPAPKGRPLFIFVLGATENEEQLEPGHWGELSLFDPHINYCVYLVGPELSEAKHKQSMKVSDRIILWYWKDNYHNFRAHQFKYGSGIARSGTIDPDLFILCNSGVGRLAAEWMPSLAAIMHSSTPAVFTTFTDDELRRDVKLLKTMNAKFVLEPAINPFASQRTRLNPVTLNIMRRSNMYLFAVKGFDGDVPKDISNVGTNDFVQQWDSLMNRKRDIIVHLPMSLVGPFIKAPKSGLPALWREFQKDPLWFVKFADFNRSLFEAKLQKAQTACITSSIDGLEKSFFVPISMWEVPCYNCGDKGMLCCSKCNLLWYCTVDCRRKLNPFHRHICEHIKHLTNEQSDLLVLEDVSHNSTVLDLLREKVPKHYYEHMAKQL